MELQETRRQVEEHTADLECQRPEVKAGEAQQNLQGDQQKLVTSLAQEEDDTLPSDTAATTDVSYILYPRGHRR